MAAQGDCGQPVSTGSAPKASDALYVLRAAVGGVSCTLGVCDVNGSKSITAADALVTLKVAVGQNVALKCPTGFAGGSFNCDFTSDNSSVLFHTAFGGESEPLPLTGRISIDCGAPGGNGEAECRCDLVQADPVPISPPSNLVACVGPIAGCGSGTIDCDGNAPRDADVVADHNIGSCTSDANCGQKCSTYCSGLSMTQTRSACEGFCENEATQCTLDDDCQSDDCPGTESHGSICQCHCVDRGSQPSSPGSLHCEVGLRIWLESSAPCGDEAVVTRLAEGCVVSTTGQAQATIKNVSNTADTNLVIDPFTGSSLSCDALAGGTQGLNLVGLGVLFDSGLDDLTGEFKLQCE